MECAPLWDNPTQEQPRSSRSAITNANALFRKPFLGRQVCHETKLERENITKTAFFRSSVEKASERPLSYHDFTPGELRHEACQKLVLTAEGDLLLDDDYFENPSRNSKFVTRVSNWTCDLL